MPVRVDSQHPPGFLLRFWLFLITLAYSFTGLFKSKATSTTTLPPPVTAGSLTTRHRPTPVFRWLKLMDAKLSKERDLQKSTQKDGLSSQSPQPPTATETHEDFVQPCSFNGCDDPDNWDDLGTKTYTIPGFPGFICGTVSPGRVSEDGIILAPTPFSPSVQPSDSVSISPLLSRRVSLGAVSICRSPTGSILSVSPVRRRLLGIPRSIDTLLSSSGSVHSVSTPPLAIRRRFSGASVRMPHLTIRLESPWSPPNKTLPLDVWVNPKGILVNARGPLGAVHPLQAEALVLQYVPHAKLPRAPSSRFKNDDEDLVSLYSPIVDLADEEGYVGEESGRCASQEFPVFAIVSPDKCSPPSGEVALATTTLSTPIEADSAVITQVSILDSTAGDVKLENMAQDHTSSALEDGFSYVVSDSRIDVASNDQIPGLAYTPSLKHRTVAAEPLCCTDRAAKCFSVPYLSSVHEPRQGPLRASTSSSSKSYPDTVEDRSSRALADLVSLLDLAALQTAETTGVSEIRMGDYVVRAA